MRAALLKGYDKKGCSLEIREVPVPEINDQEILVRIRTAGVNPLDNMIIKGEVKLIVPYSFPLIMGNEFVGIVEKTGKKVKNSGRATGSTDACRYAGSEPLPNMPRWTPRQPPLYRIICLTRKQPVCL